MFASDAGTPLFKTLETPGQASSLLFYGLIVFCILMILTALVLFILRKITN